MIDIPTTMLIQHGPVFTYFELQTSDDMSYACDYISPVCNDDVDPLALVALPH